MPKTTGLKRNIVFALQRNLKRKRKKDYCSSGTGCAGGYNSGLLHSFNNVCVFLRHILRCSLRGTIRHELFLNVVHSEARKVQARVVFCHPLHEKIKALHVVLALFIRVLVRVFEILYRCGPNILQLQLQVTNLLVLQLAEVLLHL